MGKDKGFMPAIILALIVLITTGLLALTSEMTAAARAYQADAAANRNRQAMYPTATRFDKIDLAAWLTEFPAISEAYAVRDSSGTLLGMVYQAARRGYAGNVPVLVAIGTDNQVIRVLVLANNETPGLGKKVAEAPFITQFGKLDASKEYTVKPNETDKQLIDAIAGATISSRAVTMGLNDACALHQKLAPEVK